MNNVKNCAILFHQNRFDEGMVPILFGKQNLPTKNNNYTKFSVGCSHSNMVNESMAETLNFVLVRFFRINYGNGRIL